MREIKFRSKRVENGEWVYGYYIKYKNNHFIVHGDYNPSSYSIAQGLFYPSFEVIAETVGQFTGLTDKNGKEIYEGDILENFWGKDKQTLECKYYDCGLVFEDKKDYSHRFLTDARIIGTIFDKED